MVAAFINSTRGIAVVAALLLIQLGLFLLSMDAGAFTSISIVCTGPGSSIIGDMLGLLHLLLLVLFLFGIVSLALKPARLPYIALLTVALLMLPIQASLGSNGALSCDGP